MFYNPLFYGRKAEEVLWRKVFYDIIQLIKHNRRVYTASSKYLVWLFYLGFMSLSSSFSHIAGLPTEPLCGFSSEYTGRAMLLTMPWHQCLHSNWCLIFFFFFFFFFVKDFRNHMSVKYWIDAIETWINVRH